MTQRQEDKRSVVEAYLAWTLGTAEWPQLYLYTRFAQLLGHEHIAHDEFVAHAM